MNRHHVNHYIMGVEIRQTIKQGTCQCFLLPFKKKGVQARICYHRGVLGALSDPQEIKYCTPESFVPKQEGGRALDIRSQKVQDMVATMKGFGEAAQRASSKYQSKVADDGERSMEDWRQTVGREAVKRTPIPKERPRSMSKAERQEARKDQLESSMERALDIEEKVATRKRGKAASSMEGWDSSRLGDYG